MPERITRHAALAELIERHTPADGIHASAIPGLYLIRGSQPTEPVHILHEPALCIVAQGLKRVMLAGDTYVYGPEHFILFSVDLPVMGQVLQASPGEPYLCVRLDLDRTQLNALLVEAAPDNAPSSAPATRLGSGLTLSRLEPELVDATTRLTRLLERPRDIQVLAPLCVREILYRLLAGEQGAHLRQIATADARLESIARAIAWIKRHFATPFRIETLAREAGMSASALHHHFKAVTAMSPLQYQKHVRLQEARRLMLGLSVDAATAGHRVGYDSPSQFSREYRRLFGEPPARDIAKLRQQHATEEPASA